MSRETAIQRLKMALAEESRGGWMWAEASDIGAPSLDQAAAYYEDEAVGELLDELIAEAQE
jgi:hypothetical protein